MDVVVECFPLLKMWRFQLLMKYSCPSKNVGGFFFSLSPGVPNINYIKLCAIWSNWRCCSHSSDCVSPPCLSPFTLLSLINLKFIALTFLSDVPSVATTTSRLKLIFSPLLSAQGMLQKGSSSDIIYYKCYGGQEWMLFISFVWGILPYHYVDFFSPNCVIYYNNNRKLFLTATTFHRKSCQGKLWCMPSHEKKPNSCKKV